MRSGGNCGVQQGLTAEAGSVVKAAVSLAKRRGHAQVTPLHVANTMLSASNGLLRTACLHSHSHPLQCKALELCFNVALNRLPASNSSSPMLGPMLGPSHPSISNALVAAFKRAQAHQRRGSIETQQQPLLAVKIELEQLIISILDDPSVSRVMREAGFSSTQVKTNVQQAVSTLDSSVRDEDVRSVVDYLMRNKTSTVVVGECVSSLEGVVRAVMDKAERGDLVDDFKFVSFSLSDFGHASRVEVEKRMDEIRGLATATTFHHKPFVLYVGDLKWVFEYQGRGHYCPVEHVIMEIGKLLTHGVAHSNARFWVIGVATFHTYNRCQNGCPSLDTLWGLHPFTLPASSTLGLTLISHTCGPVQKEWSKKKGENGTNWVLGEGREEEKQGDRFVAETSAKFETQVGSLPTTTCNTTTSTQLPAWLQQYKNESKGVPSNDQNCVPVCKKWNNSCMCSSPSVSPSYSSTNSYEQQHPKFWISGGGGGGGNTNNKSNHNEPTLRMYIPEHTSNPNSTTSSSDVVMETEEYYVSKFKELNSENLKTLCHALETKVPWQKHIIPEIATTVLQCRSGILTRKGITCSNQILKEDTWFLFQGVDMEGKEKIARELASLVFGSHTNLVSLALSTFSSTPEDSRNKRSRDQQSCSYVKRFADAVSRNPHSVFLVEDIDEADYCSQLGFKSAMETGILQDSNGDQVRLSDAIIILSCETQLTSIKQKSSSSRQHHDNIGNFDLEKKSTTVSPCVSLDLNISINDHHNDCQNDPSLHHNALLQSLDRRLIFNFQEL